MKKKFITKLILSGAALAASAATLVSTTYAWYVQNTQVSATGVSGAVKDDNASSIYIAKNYTLTSPNTTTWLPTVAFAAEDHIAGYEGANLKANNVITGKGVNKVFNGGLDPVTLTAAANGYFVDVNGKTTEFTKVASPEAANKANYYELDVNGNYVSSAEIAYDAEKTYYTHNAGFLNDAAAARVIEFNLYVQANVATTIRPYLLLENTTAAPKVQTAYKPIALQNDDTVDQGTSFWIDAAQALRMQVIVESAKSDLSGWDAVDSNTSNGIYDVLKVAKSQYNSSNNTYDGYELKEAALYKLTSDETPVTGKNYYTFANDTYTLVTGTPAADPKTAGYYENITITEEQLAAAGNDGLRGANKYYKDLTGRTPDGTFAERATPEAGTSIKQTTLAAAKVYKFTFRIWLEGTDPACFDSCAKQDFNIGINFDVEAPQQ